MRLPPSQSCLTLLVLFAGCNSPKSLSKDEYLVVSAERYVNKYSALPDEQSEIRFTLKHGDIKTVARCQSWDPKNNCGKLEVGRVYRLKRGEVTRDLLSADDIHVVLSVEKESLEP